MFVVAVEVDADGAHGYQTWKCSVEHYRHPEHR